MVLLPPAAGHGWRGASTIQAPPEAPRPTNASPSRPQADEDDPPCNEANEEDDPTDPLTEAVHIGLQAFVGSITRAELQTTQAAFEAYSAMHEAVHFDVVGHSIPWSCWFAKQLSM